MSSPRWTWRAGTSSAKAVGLPLCELWGGRTEEPVGLHSSISTGTPEEMVESVEAARAKGYRMHSGKVGADIALDIERIRKLNEACSRRPMRSPSMSTARGCPTRPYR